MLHILKLVPGILVVEITGMLYTRHHQWVTLDVIYLLHGTRVTREKIALVSPLKCPAWQPILNPGERRVNGTVCQWPSQVTIGVGGTTEKRIPLDYAATCSP